MPNSKLITEDPNICMGKPVISGTRITVELILDKLSHGESIEQILSAHPNLTKESILSAIEYAKNVLNSDIIYHLAG
jgi:uncharacterized protein (DUF433 family)